MISRWLFEKYVALETYLRQYLPIERKVYRINDGHELEDVSLWYYLVLFLNVWFIDTCSSYMIEYRHQNKKKIVNGNFLSVINQVRHTKNQIKAPVYGLIIKINDRVLSNEDKKKIFVHDTNDKISIIHQLYFKEDVNKIEVSCKGKTKNWKGDECNTVKIHEVLV